MSRLNVVIAPAIVKSSVLLPLSETVAKSPNEIVAAVIVPEVTVWFANVKLALSPTVMPSEAMVPVPKVIAAPARSTVELASAADMDTDVRAELWSELMASTVVVDVPAAEIVNAVRAASVVPPRAPMVAVEEVPVELMDNVSRLVPSTTAPMVDAAPAAELSDNEANAPVAVMAPVLIPALSSATSVSEDVLAVSSTRPPMVLVILLLSAFFELIVTSAASSIVVDANVVAT